MLEHLGHLEIPGAVAGRLDHRHEPHPGTEPRTEIIQVVDHGIEIDLQYRRMALAFERMTHRSKWLSRLPLMSTTRPATSSRRRLRSSSSVVR